MSDQIPRRIRFDLFVPAERAIYDATQAVEAMASDVRLTNAVILLSQAREQVADYVDGIERRRYPCGCSASGGPHLPTACPDHPAADADADHWLREEWWINHGCPFHALYGDDGEMQCNALHCRHDFKREPLKALRDYVQRRRLLHAAQAIERARATNAVDPVGGSDNGSTARD